MMQRYAAVAGLPRRRDPAGAGAHALRCPATGSAWSRRCRPASPGRWSSRCATRSSADEHDIAALRPRPARGPARVRPRRCGWPSSASGTPTSPPAGRRRRCPARRATRCRPTPTGPAAASTSTSAPAPSTRRPEQLWRVIEGIGGDNGWYSFPLAWAVRGWLDRLVGGVGLRRGRRDPQRLLRRRRARLLAGRGARGRPAAAAAGRDAAARPGLAGAARGTRPARRRDRAPAAGDLPPARAAGHLYWWAVAAFHGVVFGGMIRNIARAAEAARASTVRRECVAPTLLVSVWGPGSPSIVS